MGIIDDIVKVYKENNIEVDKERKLDPKAIRCRRIRRPKRLKKKE